MKIDHILFPVDFSEHSRALNPEVEWLAKHFGAKVTLLHVFEIPITCYGPGEAPLFDAEILERAEEKAKQQLKDYEINLPPDSVDRVVADGSAACHITNWTGDHDVDLIVMGTHGYGRLRRLLLGSVAMKVMHDVNCPIWTHSALVPQTGAQKGQISNIVCALELAVEAVPLLRFTKELAADFGANVRIVHSVPQEEVRPYTYFDRELHEDLMKLAGQEIARLQLEAGTNFSVSLTEGSIGQDVADIVLDQHSDLIVVGRGKAQATFGGLRTHAYDIIRQAPCPVLSYSMDWPKRDDFSLKKETIAEPLATL
jgi:nucleotide-binding universal stress UspA family protein